MTIAGFLAIAASGFIFGFGAGIGHAAAQATISRLRTGQPGEGA